MADEIVLVDQIEPLIKEIRGHNVILDSELAQLYDVSIKRLNEQVRRNRARFPDDFVFQISVDEAAALRSQNATLKLGRGGHRKYLPYAFTEHGAIMAAYVLNSPRAVEVGVYVVRAFVKLRQLVTTHKELGRKFAELEQRIDTHDDAIRQLIEAIRQLMEPPRESKRRGKIGFGREGDP